MSLHTHSHAHTHHLAGLLSLSQGKEARQIRNTILIGCLINVTLTIVKLLTGYFGGSEALVADGFHALGDTGSDIIMLGFVGLSFKKASDRFTYGYGKFETFASLLISCLLLFIAGHVMAESVESIERYNEGAVLQHPDIWTVVVVIISMAVKEFLFRFYRRTGKQTRSMALVSSAWHHRIDALTSIATLIGVAGAHFLGSGWRILDPAASVLIALFIIIQAIRIFLPSFFELMERSIPSHDIQEVSAIVSKVKGVKKIECIKSRKSGPYLIFDVKVAIPADMTIKEGGDIAIKIEDSIREQSGSNVLVSVMTVPFE